MQVGSVSARAAVDDGVGTVDVQGVVAVAAAKLIGALATDQRVVAGTTAQAVITGLPIKTVITGAGGKRVVAVAAAQIVVVLTAGDCVVAAAELNARAGVQRGRIDDIVFIVAAGVDLLDAALTHVE